MANWTNIPTDRIEPGKPIRAIDGLALRDNPIAIAEGASGAPKIQEAAISTNSITGEKFNDGSIRSWLGSQSAGAVGTYAFVQPTSTTSGTVRTYTWNQTVSGGTLRRGWSSPSTAGHFSGTWRILAHDMLSGAPGVASQRPGLAKRIS